MKTIRLSRIALSLGLALGVAGQSIAATSNFNIAVSGNLVGACTASSTPAADFTNEPLVAGVKPQRQVTVGVTCAGSESWSLKAVAPTVFSVGGNTGYYAVAYKESGLINALTTSVATSPVTGTGNVNIYVAIGMAPNAASAWTSLTAPLHTGSFTGTLPLQLEF